MNYLTRLLAFSLLCCLLLSACTPLTPTPTPTLIPPTETPIPSPTPTLIPPTETPIPSPTPTLISPTETTVDIASIIDQALSSATQSESFTGAVLVAREGTVLFSQGYGLADRESNLPNTPQTRYRIASLTKQFTAMAILILQAQEQLNVQDPICTYISECPTAWEEITIHHLLTHSSGITNFTSRSDYHKMKATPITPSQLIAYLKELQLDFTPGKTWSYSNSGYIVLGYIIEQASGQTYESFLQQNIFEPLQMNNTGYDHNDGSLAVGYTGYYSNWQEADYIDTSVPYAAGALYSTVEDLYIWDQALYTDQLVPQELMDLMFAPYAKIPNDILSYGYGWIVGKVDNHQMTLHKGRIEGFFSAIARFTDDKVTIIELSNRDTTNTDAIETRIFNLLFE